MRGSAGVTEASTSPFSLASQQHGISHEGGADMVKSPRGAVTPSVKPAHCGLSWLGQATLGGLHTAAAPQPCVPSPQLSACSAFSLDLPHWLHLQILEPTKML